MEPHENFYHDKHGWCYYDLTPGRAPIVYGLFVEPEYRRQGHARRLLQAVVGIIRSSGHTGDIEIEAEPTEPGMDRSALVSLYTNIGLKVR